MKSCTVEHLTFTR